MREVELERLRKARDKAALIAVSDPRLVAIFERLEAEVSAAESSADVLSRARALVARQKATA